MVDPTACLCHVLDADRQADPGVHAFFINGKRWLRKTGLCECADRNGNAIVQSFDCIVYRRTAIRAETECDLVSLVADAHVLFGLAVNHYIVFAESGLSTKNAASTTLTSKTVTDRDADRVFSCCRGELAAATSGDACGHD